MFNWYRSYCVIYIF